MKIAIVSGLGGTALALAACVPPHANHAWGGALKPVARLDCPSKFEELQLSTRTVTCLRKANVATVGDLTGRTAADLKAIRNFGDASLREVQQQLAERGLALRE